MDEINVEVLGVASVTSNVVASMLFSSSAVRANLEAQSIIVKLNCSSVCYASLIRNRVWVREGVEVALPTLHLDAFSNISDIVNCFK